jgi:mannose-6-phosphate isomerase class I
LLNKYNPWQYVNTVPVPKDQLVDLSAGGLHHSWEEDPVQAPHGNVLYELQAEALDDISTFRSFDKGKLEPDGSLRALQIDEYFKAIDRDPKANDPATHMQKPKLIRQDHGHSLHRLMTSRHYTLDKLTLNAASAVFEDKLTRFLHLFVKTGRVKISANAHSVTVGTAHSCFIPATAAQYQITNLANASDILISF